MTSFNAAQRRHVLSTFAHVDGLLGAIERLAAEGRSPFAAERPDLTPDEARLLRSFASMARERLLTALDRLGIPRPTPKLSSRWSADTTLTFADVSLSDLTAAGLRGYGSVDAEAARELEALAGDLRTLVARGKALLHEHDRGGLAERVAMIPGAAGEVLRAIDAMSTEHALVALRPLVAAAAERATALTFDVGVFGRVSAGKSSLINALVGAPLLPVGATPVTAVPIRVSRGAAGALVELLDGGVVTLAADAVASYATEAENPQNRLGVRAIELRAPDVPEGLRLLDTPGVGSLSTSGPAQAFAWLPRCDLGLVLVGAGTPVGREELALVAGLRSAGIACRVLLSKADLLAHDEAASALAYVQREIGAVLGAAHDVSVHAVSTRAGYMDGLRELRAAVLLPLAADHERAARDALRRRLHQLVWAAAAALAGEQASNAAPMEAARARERAAAAVRDVTDRLLDAAPALLRQAADAVVEAWEHGDDGRAAARGVLVAAASSALAEVRAALDAAWGSAGGAEGGDDRRIPPLFDPDLLDAIPVLPAPALGRRVIGRRVALARLQPHSSPLAAALARYSSRLYAWAMARVDEFAAPRWDGAVESPPALAGPGMERLHALVETV